MGYTRGLQRVVSRESMEHGLNYTVIKRDVVEPEAIRDAVEGEFGTTLNDTQLKTLIEDGVLDNWDDENYMLIYFNYELGYEVPDYTMFDQLSEGGVLFTTDGETWTDEPSEEEETVGVKLGVAGEHLGSVSVWLDTYHKTVSGWGETLPISAEDANALFDVATYLYEMI